MITRRFFLGAAAAVFRPRKECLELEAIAAERMPRRLVVRGVDRAAYFELRDYGEPEPQMAQILKRYGIRQVMEGNRRFLIPFETLAARERAWREVGADREWVEMCERVTVREIAVYKTVSSKDALDG